MSRIAHLFCFVIACVAQPAPVSGPVSGFVFDSAARALRPVIGIPGAALFGKPVNIGFDITSAWVAPRFDSAIALGTDGTVHVLRLAALSAVERPVAGLALVPQAVAFSPSGTAAALVANGRLLVITGLPDAPAAGVMINIPVGHSRRSDRLTAPAQNSFAVSDDGSLVLDGSGLSVRLLDSAGGIRILAEGAPGAFVAFAPGSHDGAVLQRSLGLLLFRDLGGAAGRQQIASPGGTVASPRGLAFSLDGGKLFVADSKTNSVVRFELATQTSASTSCACAISELVSMGTAFRLNEPGPEPLWLLDTIGPEPRLVFVPKAVPD